MTNIEDYQEIESCLLCGSAIEMVLPLTPTPPANELLETPQEQDEFPLNLVKCKACNHLQLDASVDRERLYRHYLYCSDTSASNRTYFEGYANDMIERFFPDKTGMVLDIASNDGLFLSFFQKQGIKVLGIDPAKNIAEAANKKGIDTWSEFFNAKNAYRMHKIYGEFPLITCNNAFAHNDNLLPILEGVKELLADDGAFVVEVQYAMDMLENGTFDLLYHEHIHSHHLTPLVEFFKKNGLRIYDAQRIATGWGSLRIFACKSNADFHPTKSFIDIMTYEAKELDGLLKSFTSKIETNKEKVVSLLKGLKVEGKTISVLGHPARAMTLAYYFGLVDNKIITDVFDDNTLKIGRYSPCTPNPILPSSAIYKKKPDYLLVLSWNYAEAMMKIHAGIREWGGKFIVPLPEIRVV